MTRHNDEWEMLYEKLKSELASVRGEAELHRQTIPINHELFKERDALKESLKLAFSAGLAYANAMAYALRNGIFAEKMMVMEEIERILVESRARETLEGLAANRWLSESGEG